MGWERRVRAVCGRGRRIRGMRSARLRRGVVSLFPFRVGRAGNARLTDGLALDGKSSGETWQDGTSSSDGATPKRRTHEASASPASSTLPAYASGSSMGAFSERFDDARTDGHLRPPAKPSASQVPPVPPLPKSYQPQHGHQTEDRVPRSSTMNDFTKIAAYYVPVKDDSASLLAVPSSFESRMSNSASSPALGTEVNSDPGMTDLLKSPALSVTSTDSFAAAQGSTSRPRMMSKKWSFSSALSFTSVNKHKSDALSPGLPSPGLSHGAQMDGTLSPPSVYASPLLSTSELDGLAPPPLSHKSSGTSESGSTTRAPLSATTNGHGDAYVPASATGSSTSRRGTTTSLPFFRRSSSTSFQAPSLASRNSGIKVQEPMARNDKALYAGAQRKTVLGIGIPAMLGGSKRNSITQETLPQEDGERLGLDDTRPRHERKGSFGWGGRKRGKVSGRPAKRCPPLIPNQTLSTAPDGPTKLPTSSSAYRLDEPSHRYPPSKTKRSSYARDPESKYDMGSVSSQRSALGHLSSHFNLPTSRSAAVLPTVTGSPSRGSPSNAQRYGGGSITSATPTRIPRISKTVVAGQQKVAATPLASKSGEGKASNGSYADLIITADQLRAPARSRNHDSPQDLPRTEESEQIIPKLNPPGTRHVSGSSIASGKRVLPEPPRTPGQEPTKSFANRSPATASGRVSTVSVHSSVFSNSRPSSSHASGSRSASPANVTLDEDERVGDEEMAAFYRRQRARQSKGEKMSGELEASLNFPDPIEPAEAMSPHGESRRPLEDGSLTSSQHLSRGTLIPCRFTNGGRFSTTRPFGSLAPRHPKEQQIQTPPKTTTGMMMSAVITWSILGIICATVTRSWASSAKDLLVKCFNAEITGRESVSRSRSSGTRRDFIIRLW